MLPYGCRSVTRFEKLNLIGEGTYGTVYRARDRASGDIVALKKIRPMKGGSGGGFPLTSIREVSLLQAVSHPNIIRLREIAVGRKVDNIFLVFDYCAHDLASLVERLSRPFAEAEVKQIMCQLLEATAYLHANFIVHRDLKLSNLLVDAQGRLKVIIHTRTL
jgi:serine/threonine protein kinase